jgi:hypothetical protein
VPFAIHYYFLARFSGLPLTSHGSLCAIAKQLATLQLIQAREYKVKRFLRERDEYLEKQYKIPADITGLEGENALHTSTSNYTSHDSIIFS